MKISFYVIIQKYHQDNMVKKSSCNCNDVHHTGHDYIHYKHVGNQCIHPDGRIHKIGEK